MDDVMTARQVDLLLDRCSDMQGQRDRAIVQRAGMEGHLWFAECLLKQIAALLPRMIAATPADAVARDSLVEQAVEFLSEPRHSAKDSVLPGDADVQMSSAGDAGQDGTTS